MPPLKTQQHIFISEALPSLFHQTPEMFIKYLDEDGKNFLRFWWEQVGENVEKASVAAGEQLNLEVHRTLDDVTIVIITLPKPKYVGEAYFAALIYRPVKFRIFIRRALTRFIVLESCKDKKGEYGTLFVERTAMKRRKVLGSGPKEPSQSAFYRIVFDMVSKKK